MFPEIVSHTTEQLFPGLVWLTTEQMFPGLVSYATELNLITDIPSFNVCAKCYGVYLYPTLNYSKYNNFAIYIADIKKNEITKHQTLLTHIFS